MYSAILFSIATLILSYAASVAGLSLGVSPQQQAISYSSPSANVDSTLKSLKVPGRSPAYHCSDPSNDIFQIRDLDFLPRNPRIGFYFTIRFIGHFTSATGDVPWLNITGSLNGREELEPFYYSPLCDLDVFQNILVPRPGDDHQKVLGSHRSCPPAIQEGYGVIWSPPIPLNGMIMPEGEYKLRAEATTQDDRRIFCVEGSFNITT